MIRKEILSMGMNEITLWYCTKCLNYEVSKIDTVTYEKVREFYNYTKLTHTIKCKKCSNKICEFLGEEKIMGKNH